MLLPILSSIRYPILSLPISIFFSFLIIWKASQVSDHSGEEDDIEDPTSEAKGKYVNKKWSEGKTSEEEKDHLMNEKKQQKEESLKAYVPLVRCNNSMSSSNPKPSGMSFLLFSIAFTCFY